ncbi:hypothetical protein OPIT5_15395 [Opitutaceae bacterium TAV5]|nr:hypothetical protein OPIT5_15395 [Opitutaceae bacterium TAV5]
MNSHKKHKISSCPSKGFRAPIGAMADFMRGVFSCVFCGY